MDADGDFVVVWMSNVDGTFRIRGQRFLSPYPPTSPGDCNGDDAVEAGDVAAIVLEIFDGDGAMPEDAPDGTFDGDPIGCDANADDAIDAGDLACTVNLVFGGPGACAVP